jgi:hypothetical protein
VPKEAGKRQEFWAKRLGKLTDALLMQVHRARSCRARSLPPSDLVCSWTCSATACWTRCSRSRTTRWRYPAPSSTATATARQLRPWRWRLRAAAAVCVSSGGCSGRAWTGIAFGGRRRRTVHRIVRYA